MTIAGTLTVSASDDPRFTAGQSIGIVIDSSCEVTTSTNVEVSAPTPSAPAPTEVETPGDVVSTEVETTAEDAPEPTIPATA
jgi:hypothetical protein